MSEQAQGSKPTFELTAQLTFVCATEEKAKYIEALLNDLHPLIECGSSYMESTITQTHRV